MVNVVDVFVEWLPVQQTMGPVEPGVMHAVQDHYTEGHVEQVGRREWAGVEV